MKYIFIALLLSFTSCFAQEIAITFDDAPTNDGPLFNGQARTERILKHLQKHKIQQVAFFVTTGNIINPTAEKRLKLYADNGHLIANHTHTHRPIHILGTDNYVKDIQKADTVLRQYNGFTPWFRYPFLDEGKTPAIRDSIRNALAILKLSNGYVTIDNYEWYLNSLLHKAVQKKLSINYDALREVYLDHLWNSVLFYDKIARKVLGRSPKHVLLLHENDLAALYLDDLISLLIKKGWKIISPMEAYNDPIATNIPDVLMNGQGRVAAIAKAKGMAGHDLVQPSEDEPFLDALVKEKDIFKP